LRSFFVKAVVGVLLVLFASSPAHAVTFPGRNGDIIFTKEAQSELWAMTSKGKKPRKVLSDNIQSPSFSPDGQKIAYIHNGTVEMLDYRTGKRQKLTHSVQDTDSAPAWSYDGSQIAFIRERQSDTRQAVIAFSLTSGNEKNITGWRPVVKAFSWAPDNKRIVYEQRDETGNSLRIVQLQTNTSTYLTTVSDDPRTCNIRVVAER
jgi:Tol biopolymer transport system component